MNQDPKRATGRTLGLALQSIGKAVENPGTNIEFIDHYYPQNHAQYQLCKEKIESIAKQLNLDVTVLVSYYGHGPKQEWKLLVKSNWISLYSQRTPAEEAYKKLHGMYPCYSTDWEIFEEAFNLGVKEASK